MSQHIPPLPFTINVYNSLSQEFSSFLLQTYPHFFDALFEKYQILYGFNPNYILNKHFQVHKHELHDEKDSPTKEVKEGKHPCQISQDIQETYTKLLAFIHEDTKTWNAIVDNEALQVHRKQVDNSPVWTIKSKTVLENISADQVFEAIYKIDVRRKWDTVFEEFKQVPFPFISSREFLQRRHFIHHFPSYNQTIIQFKSIELEECPHDPNKIRGETAFSGYLITALEKNKCQLELISTVDIKGDIPKFLYNLVAQKAPISWVENLKNHCLGKPLKNKIF